LKNEKAYVKKFTALMKRVGGLGSDEVGPKGDAVSQMVVGFLQWNATVKQAQGAYKRMMDTLVDLNELRVSHPHEIVEMSGVRYPLAKERAKRLNRALQEVYLREHCVSLTGLSNKTKKQARQYLDSLPGMVPYVAAQVMLLCFSGHAVPVDDVMLSGLKEERVVNPEATVEEVEAFLSRQIKASNAVQSHGALKAWSDERTPKPQGTVGAKTKKTQPKVVKKQAKVTKNKTAKIKPTKTSVKKAAAASTKKKKVVKKSSKR